MRTLHGRPPLRAARAVSARRRSRWPSLPLSSRSASAPTPRSSASSTPCCCGRCRSTSPIASCGCSTCRRRRTFPGMQRFSVSPANFYDWQRDGAVASTAMALYRYRAVHADRRRQARKRVVAGAVGAGFFESSARRPRSGACSSPRKIRPARRTSSILSDGFWKTHFGGAPDVVGRTLHAGRRDLHDRRRDAGAASRCTAWGVDAPRHVGAARVHRRRNARFATTTTTRSIARLKPGVSVAQAQSEMEVISTAARAGVSAGERRLGRDGRFRCRS